jgi:uncharacterized membrane protein
MNTISNAQLVELVNAGLIDDATAAKIENYYLQKKQTAPNRFAILLWILGAVLIGSGIVLIVAHNWDEFSKPVRTFLALLPLALAQGFCFYVLRYRSANPVLKEISAVFLFFAVAAAISLIGQIYQVDGTLASFLQSWILLTIPLVYLLRSQVVSLFIIALATWQACLLGYRISYGAPQAFPYLYPIVMVLLLPNYLRLMRENFSRLSFYFHNWLLVASITIVLGALEVNTNASAKVFISAYMGLFVSLFLVGKLPVFQKSRIGNPFLLVGRLGFLVMMIIWTYPTWWRFYETNPTIVRSSLAYVTILFGIIIASLFIRQKRNADSDVWLIAPMFFIFSLTIFLAAGNPSIGALILNVCLLAISIFYIRKGAQTNHLPTMNLGILIIAALAVIRFFDDNIPFIIRGLFFLVTGIGFFLANFLMLRKRKQSKQPAEL